MSPTFIRLREQYRLNTEFKLHLGVGVAGRKHINNDRSSFCRRAPVNNVEHFLLCINFENTPSFLCNLVNSWKYVSLEGNPSKMFSFLILSCFTLWHHRMALSAWIYLIDLNISNPADKICGQINTLSDPDLLT